MKEWDDFNLTLRLAHIDQISTVSTYHFRANSASEFATATRVYHLGYYTAYVEHRDASSAEFLKYRLSEGKQNHSYMISQSVRKNFEKIKRQLVMEASPKPYANIPYDRASKMLSKAPRTAAGKAATGSFTACCHMAFPFHSLGSTIVRATWSPFSRGHNTTFRSFGHAGPRFTSCLSISCSPRIQSGCGWVSNLVSFPNNDVRSVGAFSRPFEVRTRRRCRGLSSSLFPSSASASPSSSLLFGGVFGGDRFNISVSAEAPGALTEDGLLSGDTGSETSSMIWLCNPSAFLTGDLSSSAPRLKYDSMDVCAGRWRGGETLLPEALSERA